MAEGETVTREAWQREAVGPLSVAEVMAEFDEQVARDAEHLRPLPLGFDPLDDVLNGGLRRGELAVVGGAFGVGKTIFGLQAARNAVIGDERIGALYVCYEHDRVHLLSRLMCLESAERSRREDALTLRRLQEIALKSAGDAGLFAQLREAPRLAPLVRALEAYGPRLVLAKASGDTSDLAQVRRWVEEAQGLGVSRLLVVVDYLQKVPVPRHVHDEDDAITLVAQGLKEMAMSLGVSVLAIAASDREGLHAKRMRLADMRGSSALQYEADIGLVLNNKHEIVSREHMVYNPSQAEAMRNWVVVSVEKNRAGRNAVDIEFPLDAAHFRIVPQGGLVRERLIDERVVLE